MSALEAAGLWLGALWALGLGALFGYGLAAVAVRLYELATRLAKRQKRELRGLKR